MERLKENQSPTSISANSELRFPEHQPVGTIISSFTATDPDVTSSITFHLASGLGDDNNSLFNLETNGTLSTASSFDYESQDSNYSILLWPTWIFRLITQQFTISLQDIDEGTMPVDGNGSEQNPYLIANLANLKWITYNPSSWSSHFLQTADINASDTRNWNDGKGFKPIGFDFDNNPFTGVYDGSHHLITDLFINRPDQYVGLFGYIDGGLGVRKVNLRNIHLTGSDTGSIVGQAFNNLRVEYCSSVDANLTGRNVGGLVGYVIMGGGLIKFSSFEGSVDGTGSVGGIAAHFGILLWIVVMQ